MKEKMLEELLEDVGGTTDTLKEIVDYIKEQEVKLRREYDDFIKTDEGKKWKRGWVERYGTEVEGDFGDYLYDFYPEMLQ